MQQHPSSTAAAPMRAIRPLWREVKLAYLQWALREIDPLHPDVPEIVLEVNQLQSERRSA